MESKIKLMNDQVVSLNHNHTNNNNNNSHQHSNGHHLVSGHELKKRIRLSANDEVDDQEHEEQEKARTKSDATNAEQKIANAYSNILDAIGEDSQREGLLKTPLRAALALTYFTKGYKEDLKSIAHELFIFGAENANKNNVLLFF